MGWTVSRNQGSPALRPFGPISWHMIPHAMMRAGAIPGSLWRAIVALDYLPCSRGPETGELPLPGDVYGERVMAYLGSR